MKTVFLIIYILCVHFSSNIFAQDFNKEITTNDVRCMIKKYGPIETVNQLAQGDWHNWLTIEKNISNGDTDWIELAPYLRLGTDAGTSVGIIVALATALPKNPIAVLKLEDNNMSLKRVCSFPFIEPTHDFIKDYSESAIQALNSIDDPRFLAEAEVCKIRLNAIINVIANNHN
jgi:hypothetical protein